MDSLCKSRHNLQRNKYAATAKLDATKASLEESHQLTEIFCSRRSRREYLGVASFVASAEGAIRVTADKVSAALAWISGEYCSKRREVRHLNHPTVQNTSIA